MASLPQVHTNETSIALLIVQHANEAPLYKALACLIYSFRSSWATALRSARRSTPTHTTRRKHRRLHYGDGDRHFVTVCPSLGSAIFGGTK